MSRVGEIIVCLVLLGMLGAPLRPAPAAADYFQDFELLSDGLLPGQDAFYRPIPTDTDYVVYPYAGNALGLSPNPSGGSKFTGGVSGGDPAYARVQRDISFDAGNLWTIRYDFAGKFSGTGATQQNLGSFSLLGPATPGALIHLMSWVDPGAPTAFNAFYLTYDALGNGAFLPGMSPGSAWENLAVDHWYRSWTTVDLDLNRVTEVGIQDLSAPGAPTTYSPTDWYLAGGAGASNVLTSFRLFTGGANSGNVMAFDNIGIEGTQTVPAPGAFVLAFIGAATVTGLRRQRR